MAQSQSQGKSGNNEPGRRSANSGSSSGKEGARSGNGSRSLSAPVGTGVKSELNGVRAKSPAGSLTKPSGGTRSKGARGSSGKQVRGKLKSASTQPPTPPLVRKEISAILMMALGILLFMGIFLEETAGSFGYALQVLAGGLFGVTAWALPFLVFGQGAYRMFSHSGHPLWNRFFNFILLLMLISAMFAAGAHPLSFYRNISVFKLLGVFFNEGINTLGSAAIQTFYGGGLFGGILGVPLLLVFQKAGAMVVLATLGLVVALIVTRISIMDAARSVARGTAGTFSIVLESSRRRREARLEMYRAQTVAGKEMTTSQWFGKKTLMDDGSVQGTLPGKIKQAVAREKDETLIRQRGGRFLEVASFDPWDLPEDQEPEQGPTFQYPSSFVHIDRDVGDLRIGREDDSGTDPMPYDADPPLHEPGPDERLFSVQDPFSRNGPTVGKDKTPKPDPLAAAVSGAGNPAGPGKDQMGKALKNGASPANDPLTGKPVSANPKAEWTDRVPEPPPNGDQKRSDIPERDLAKQWEDNLKKEDASRRSEGAAPALAEGYRVVDLPDGRPYTFPPIMLLKQAREDEQNMRRIRATADENARKLEATLESFGIGAKVIHISVGPAITRYELHPAPGIKVSRIVNLTDDIAMNLASSGVRIEAPIPGKAAIGVEVPNKEVAPISLRSVLESPEFEKHPSRLAVALGKDISGENMVVDLAKMPHLLIAGATGSGKSVCINSIVVSLLYKSKPEEVKLLMIDPKVVELGVYNGIPHLLIPVVTDPNKAAGALRWAVQEMIMRYKLFAEKSARDLAGFNNAVEETGTGMKLPQIVIIIDELADLMMVAPHDVEDSICRLAQMARAAGMHLVIATQRPSVNVITGVIKANIPSRVAFSVSSQVDSRTIIDMAGAEKLLGKGDMLYYPVGFPKPVRVKGAFITDKEVELVVEHVKAQMRVKYDEEIIDNINENQPPEDEDAGVDDSDELLDQAIEALIDSGQASVSFIQRRFKVGYARAGRIIDQMAERGIISGYEGSKPRRVLITRDMWNEMRMQSEIRAAEASRNGRAIEQQRMHMQAYNPARSSELPASADRAPMPASADRAPMPASSEGRAHKPSASTERMSEPGAAFGSSTRQTAPERKPVPVPKPVSMEDMNRTDPVRVVGSAAESSFLNRAMADADERESHQRAYGDTLPSSPEDAGYDSLWTDPEHYREEID